MEADLDESTQTVFEELRKDVRLLGQVLGKVLRESGGSDLYRLVEALRDLATTMREEPDEAHVQALAERVGHLELVDAEGVARAFTCYFHLVNLAEERARVRMLRGRGQKRVAIPDSIAAAINDVVGQEGREGLTELLGRMSVQPVFTAHPTEARRRVVTEALRRIGEQLERLDMHPLPRTVEQEVERRLCEEVEILFRTAHLRDRKPDPLDEVRRTLAVFDETLFLVLPRIYREVDRALSPELSGTRPPTFPPFLSWGSWVGGDRDGNPFVTHETTLKAMTVARQHVLHGLSAAASRIARMLTLDEELAPPPRAFQDALASFEKTFPERATDFRRRTEEQPYRRFLMFVAERLDHSCDDDARGYLQPDALVRDLMMLQQALAQAGAERLAYGELQHLLWQAQTFGFHFASLEIRQDSGTHDKVLAEVAPDAVRNLEALEKLAVEGFPPGTEATSELAQEVLGTIRAVAEIQRRYGVSACRRYAVSWSREAVDVMTVRALMRLALPDQELEVEVVPLFESRADLERAPSELDKLLTLPSVQRRLADNGRSFEVMLGYSDSTKDAGFLAANLALYQAQRSLADWAKRNNITLTLFHGRGGAIGRGGGPANRAILGQAHGSVDGRLKLTEQGESIFGRYRTVPLAQRHLEQLTNATMRASLRPWEPRQVPRLDWDLLHAMAGAAEEAYRSLVNSEGFARFFVEATPYDELSDLQLGSRPAKRRASGGLDTLRAIPWSFSWTQSRINVPAWFGLGAGLSVGVERVGMPALRELRNQWPFFRTLIDNASLSLVKADPLIARRYLALAGRDDLAAVILDEYEKSKALLLELLEQRRLLDEKPFLRQSVDMRNPYVDVLSFVQLHALRKAREDGPDAARYRHIVKLTVSGVSAGLQDTG